MFLFGFGLSFQEMGINTLKSQKAEREITRCA
jgi:hypothetical protein